MEEFWLAGKEEQPWDHLKLSPFLGNLDSNQLSHPELSWQKKDVVEKTETSDLKGYPSNGPCHQKRGKRYNMF